MPSKALASLNIVIGAITQPLFRGLAIARARLMKFAATMKAVGSSIMMSFTMPFAMIAAAGGKMAMDFEKNMTKIVTQVGLVASEVNVMNKEIMKMSEETATGPAELAEGLFFLTSAGLRGANAMETLNQVAKATAQDFGESESLALVAAAAQNAYGEEVLTSSEALDIFGMAIRKGMFKAQDLAESMGENLGFAADLNVSFKEVNAIIATMTRTTGDARGASTGLGGVLMALAKKTQKGANALDKINMSYEGLRRMVQEKGLKESLFHLKEAFAAKNVDMTEFFGKAKAVKMIMGVLGNQAGSYTEILGDMSNATGLVNEGFDFLQKQTGFKLQKAWNGIKNVAMEIGAMVMPIILKLANALKSAGQAFMGMESGTKKLIMGIATLIAFSGPLMMFGGALVSLFTMVLSPVGLVIAAIAGLGYIVYKQWDTIKPILVKFINYWIDLWNESEAFRTIVVGVGVAFKILWLYVKFYFTMIWNFIKSFGNNFVEMFSGFGQILKGVFTGSWEDIKAGAQQAWDAMAKGLGEAVEETKKAAEVFGKEVMEEYNKGMAIVQSKEKIEFITEEDIDRNVDNIVGWIKDKAKKVSDAIKNMMGGGAGMLATSPSGPLDQGNNLYDPVGSGSGTPGTGFASLFVPEIDKSKSALTKFGEWFKGQAGDWGETWQDKMGQAIEAITLVMNQVAGLWNQQHTNKMLTLDNEEAAEIKNVENSSLNEKKKQKAISDINEKYNTKRKKAEQDHAKRQKKLAIFSAIIAGAQAVVTALGAPWPMNLILVPLVAGLAAAQIAAIASQPLPSLAGGGLAFGPSMAMVGDNPNSGIDPEVIAPLSKLKGMMGGQIEVVGVIKGNDIFLSNEKAGDSRQRFI